MLNSVCSCLATGILTDTLPPKEGRNSSEIYPYVFILAILIWGFTGLTFKDAILFTSVGLSISVVALSALLVVALTFVMAAMYAAHELGSLGKMIISQVVLVGFWNLIFLLSRTEN